MPALGKNWNHSKRWSQWLEELGLGVEIVCHKEREPDSHYDFPRVWNTYLFFGDKVRHSRDEKLCEPYVERDPLTSYLWENREALDGLEGWNGGPTFSEFVTDSIGCRRIKIGDDFQHLWDQERKDLYNLEYMQGRVLKTAIEAGELLKFLMKELEPKP